MELISCIKNFPKHCKTAFQNIWRNGVMSVSSIFAVTITLVLIAVISVVAINIQDMTYSIEDSLTIYVKMDRELKDADAKKLQPTIEKISGVKKVTFSTKDQELDKIIESQKEDGKEIFETYRKNNPLGAAYIVEVEDAKQIDKITEQINVLEHVNEVNSGGSSTNSLVNTLETVRNGGAVFVVGLTVVALFMIANTIKITITSRQTEISIMRMVGASNWYIRLPYMLEGIFIGVLGSIIPILIVYFGYSMVYEGAVGILPAMLSLREPFPFIWQCSGLLVALGSGVGLIGSFVSVRKFLKF
ncbi:permease-like cell division protein FtsX [Candidatus Stoquefichus massiliensis]|uniref:permease-like cell division protein FtsX n=1 Tax=Candidatus Stoquefichus massiliensis TaxID=1470350 RepID=UPI00047FDE3B|nr:permease-like cell division protein FtsX [Candidatus Stoquefichus massiliensis]